MYLLLFFIYFWYPRNQIVLKNAIKCKWSNKCWILTLSTFISQPSLKFILLFSFFLIYVSLFICCLFMFIFCVWLFMWLLVCLFVTFRCGAEGGIRLIISWFSLSSPLFFKNWKFISFNWWNGKANGAWIIPQKNHIWSKAKKRDFTWPTI